MATFVISQTLLVLLSTNCIILHKLAGDSLAIGRNFNYNGYQCPQRHISLHIIHSIYSRRLRILQAYSLLLYFHSLSPVHFLFVCPSCVLSIFAVVNNKLRQGENTWCTGFLFSTFSIIPISFVTVVFLGRLAWAVSPTHWSMEISPIKLYSCRLNGTLKAPSNAKTLLITSCYRSILMG